MSLRRSVSTVYVHCICSVYSVSYSVSHISINLQCQVYLLLVSVGVYLLLFFQCQRIYKWRHSYCWCLVLWWYGVASISRVYSEYVQCVFRVYTKYITVYFQCMYTVYSEYTQSIFIVSSEYIQRIFSVYSQYICYSSVSSASAHMSILLSATTHKHMKLHPPCIRNCTQYRYQTAPNVFFETAPNVFWMVSLKLSSWAV